MTRRLYLSFTFVMIVSALMAQNPGGVSASLTLWLKANSGTSTTTNGTPLSTWNYSNNGFSFSATGTDRPTYNTSVVNFLPGINFNSFNLMDGPVGINAPIAAGNDAYSFFGVWNSTSAAGTQRIWSQRSTGSADDGTSLWTYAGQFGNQPEIGPAYTYGMGLGYSANTWNISQLNLLNAATNDEEIIGQSGSTTVTTDPLGNGAGRRNLSDLVNRLGQRDVAVPESYSGSLAELIVFNTPTSGTDRAKIFSYLALKYGITINQNQIASSGTTIWNSSNGYNNAVFGLGRDNSSGLLVTQSNSALTGSGNGAGVSGAGNIVLSNPSAIATDLSFLEIGNNNGSLTENTTNLPTATPTWNRFPRAWKAQATLTVGTVDLSFDYTGLTVSGTVGVAGNFRLAVDPDGDGNFATGTTRFYTPSGFTGNIANYNGVTLNDGEVFTFLSNPSGTLPVTWTDFTAKATGGYILLKWSVANNEQAAVYEIEHSTDGISYTRIATVKNLASVTSYSYNYTGAEGRHYFRIHQVDLDGKAVYSKTVSASLKSVDFAVRLLNNPTRNSYAEVEVNSLRTTNVTVELLSANGVKIIAQQQKILAGLNNININLDRVAAGNYIIRLYSDQFSWTDRLIKL